MSQRPSPKESEFGSDSFLDVIANIVGILVILIVLAGLKVSRMPVVTKSSNNPAVATVTDITATDRTATEPAVSEPMQPAAELPTEDPLPADLQPVPPTIEIPPQEVPAEKLVVEAARPVKIISLSPNQALREEAEQAALSTSRLETEIESLTAQVAEQEQSLLRAQSQARVMASELQAGRELLRAKQNRLTQAHEQLLAARQKLATLRARVIETDFAPPNVEKIEHRVTPVGRVVKGSERHFRFDRGRVAEVPVDALVEQVKRQIESRKDWLIKTSKAQGEVGPVGGFLMRYTVQRENSGVLSELEMGPGLVSISVTQWLIQPSRELQTESVEEAMQTGSRFYRSLLTTPEDATLTFWVYPDSFSEFQRIRKFVHEQGFLVAARPLPKGVPIAGSPHGTRSSAQ
jgi:hypothetical protein